MHQSSLLPRLFLSGFLLFTIFFAFSPAQTLAQAANPAAANFSGCGGTIVAPINAEFEQKVVELTNSVRVAEGLPPLKLNPDLMNAARYHTADMEQDDYFKHRTHDRVNGELVEVCEWFERVASFLPESVSSAENIAAGQRSPDEVIQTWLDSSDHRDSMLSDSFREMGAGFAGDYWAQDFAVRSGVFPLIINNEAATTESTQVTLFVHGGWDEMRVRNASGANSGAWGAWQPFASLTTWTLPDEPGLHTVEVEMRRVGHSSSSSDSIVLLDAQIDLPPLPTAPPPPTAEPTSVPAPEPTAEPTSEPTVEPTAEPTVEPTSAPTLEPTSEPTSAPTGEPTVAPTSDPTLAPTLTPTPTPLPTETSPGVPATPTSAPTSAPLPTTTPAPTDAPTVAPPSPAPTSTPPLDGGGSGEAPQQVDLVGQVQLQQRPPTANASWSVPLLVELYDAQGSNLVRAYTPHTTDTGAFELTGVRLGRYRLAVQTARTLKRVVDLNVTASQSLTIEPLIAGDAVDDERINIRDFSWLARTYANCTSAENPFLLADFNGSGCVDDGDVALLRENFNRVGDTIVPSSGAGVMLPVSGEDDLRQGSRISVALRLNSTQPLLLDGLALYLNFDPTQMQVLHVTGDDAFNVVLQNEFDNVTGRVDYVAGTLDGAVSPPPALAVVTFELQTDVELGTLVLNTSDAVRTSDIVYHGESQINGDWQTHSIVPAVRVVSQAEAPQPQPPLETGVFLPLVTSP